MYKSYEHLVNRLIEAEQTCNKEHLAQCLPMSSAKVVEEWMTLLISGLADVTEFIRTNYGSNWNVHVAVDEIRLSEHKEDECPYYVTDFDELLYVIFDCLEKQKFVYDERLEGKLGEALDMFLSEAVTAVFDIDIGKIVIIKERD